MKFNILKTEITVSYLIICIAALSIIAGVFDRFLWCVFAVIIHETGHIAAMCCLKTPPQKIKISLFEISISDKKRNERSAKNNFLIIFFGPFVNFICFIIFYLLYLVYGSVFILPATANLSVGLFNALPVLTLDGGQMLFLILSRFYSVKLSEKIVNAVTVAIIFPLAVTGFIILFKSKYNFSLLLVCIYLIFCLVCKDSRCY